MMLGNSCVIYSLLLIHEKFYLCTEAEKCTFLGPLPIELDFIVGDCRRPSPTVGDDRRLSPIVADDRC